MSRIKNNNNTGSYRKRGADALAQLQKDKQKQESGGANKSRIFKFWVPKGEQSELTILDNRILSSDENEQGGVYIAEHSIQTDGQWRGETVPCIADMGHECPYCNDGAPSRVVYVTVATLYEKDGKQHSSRKLLPIKGELIDKMLKWQEIAVKKYGTCRGLTLNMERSMKKKALATGEPTPYEDGESHVFLNKEELEAEYGHEEIKTQDGTVVVPKNGHLQPFNYDEVFPEPDPEAIWRKYNGEQEEQSEESQPNTSSPRRSRGSSVAKSDSDDEWGDDEEESEAW